MMLKGMAPLSLMNLNNDNENDMENDGYEIVPKKKGPRALLKALLSQDPAFQQLFKTMKISGENDYASMGTDIS